jgi:negative regulator of flagellin synthesis FlgM
MGLPTPEASSPAETPEQVSDHVDLTSTTQIRKFAEVAETLPNVRLEKVEGLREQIDDGSYYVESDKLARKVVDEALSDILALGPR